MAKLVEWVDWAVRAPSPDRFTVVDVAESKPHDEDVRDYMANLLLGARLDPEYLRFMGRLLGWDVVEDLLKGSLPERKEARRAEFGEVFLPAMCAEFHGYSEPIHKLRFMVIGGQTMPGTDALVVKTDSDGNLVEVCYCEAKLRTVRDPGVCVAGATQLQGDYASRLPDILRFISARLFERGDPLMEVFAQYLKSRRESLEFDSFRLGVFVEKDVWDESWLNELEQANEVDVPGLTLDVVLVDKLGPLTDDVFERIGVETILDDDDRLPLIR